jgi:hypothetical protein
MLYRSLGWEPRGQFKAHITSTGSLQVILLEVHAAIWKLTAPPLEACRSFYLKSSHLKAHITSTGSLQVILLEVQPFESPQHHHWKLAGHSTWSPAIWKPTAPPLEVCRSFYLISEGQADYPVASSKPTSPPLEACRSFYSTWSPGWFPFGQFKPTMSPQLEACISFYLMSNESPSLSESVKISYWCHTFIQTLFKDD